MNTKHFAVIKEPDYQIIFDIHTINEKGLMSPILWCRTGMFRLIPSEVILNIIDNAEMYGKISSKRIHPKLRILWDQGIPISNQAGRALIGE